MMVIFCALLISFTVIIGWLLIPVPMSIKQQFFPFIAILSISHLVIGISLVFLTLMKKVSGRLKKFLILTGSSSAGFFISVLLHNFLYGLSVMAKRIPILSSLLKVLHAVFFIIAIFVCPLGFLIGVTGVLILFIKKRKVPNNILIICVLIGTATFGFVSYMGWRYIQVVRLIAQATEFKVNENHEKAIILLNEAQTKTLINDLKDNVTRELAENEQLTQDKSNYYQGIKQCNEGNWQEALDWWKKIPDNSFYAQKVKVEKEVPHAKPSGGNVHLVNYTHAKDPTWEELIKFLKTDATDSNPYEENVFICTDFAETLHNNAEKAGIKAAYVGVNFTVGQGHAINAFHTVDRGLVYIDNTGKGFSNMREDFLDADDPKCEWDKVGYLSEGKEYGSISINYPSLDPVEYQFYENHTALWMEVETELKKYDQEIQDYNNKKQEYEATGFTYEQDREDYEEMLDDYSENVRAAEVKIEQEYEGKRNSLKSEFDAWEGRKKEYERKVEEYNERVAKYNNEGVGDPEELESEGQALDTERKNLNLELEKLNGKAETLNEENETRVQKEIKKFDEQKKKLDDTLSALEELKEELVHEKSDLDSIVEELNKKLNTLKQQEESLATCYWKPLGEVTEIKTYW